MAGLRRRCRHRLGGHVLRFQTFHHQRPARIIPRHRVHRRISLQIELRGGVLAAVAPDAMFGEIGPDGLLKLLVKRKLSRGAGGCAGGDARQQDEKGS